MRTSAKSKTLAFTDSKTMFREYLGKTSFDYSEWDCLPAECKGVALYLNFYDTIMAALYRARQHRPIPGDDTELVSVAIDKCQRVVDILKEHPEKYTKGYMSVIMYNAFADALSQLVSSKQKQFDVFNVVRFSETYDTLQGGTSESDYSDGGDLNVAFCIEMLTEQSDIHNELRRMKFEAILDGQPEYVQEVVTRIINGGKLCKRQQQMLTYLREIFGELVAD